MSLFGSFVVQNGQRERWAHFPELETQERDETATEIQPEGMQPLIVIGGSRIIKLIAQNFQHDAGMFSS